MAIILLPTQVSAIDIDLDIGIKLGNNITDDVKITTTKNTNNSDHKRNGPPSHAPAHGYRAKHNYHYYPTEQVYFDSNRGLYFYLSNRIWEISTKLPLNLKVQLGSHVSIEMETDKPYVKHAVHKAKYPPGQWKKVSKKTKAAKKHKHNKKKHK